LDFIKYCRSCEEYPQLLQYFFKSVGIYTTTFGKKGKKYSCTCKLFVGTCKSWREIISFFVHDLQVLTNNLQASANFIHIIPKVVVYIITFGKILQELSIFFITPELFYEVHLKLGELQI